MTIYGRYNKESGYLETMSDGEHSAREWEPLSMHENANEARREFFRYKNGEYVPGWTSDVKWEGAY